MNLEPIHLLTLLVAVGVGIQWIAARLRLPALILLLIAGFALGPASGLLVPSEVFGKFESALIGMAVAIVLFEGGLTLDFREAKFAGAVLLRLIISGLVVGFGVVTVLGVCVGGLSLATSAVLGAILVVTGPTVILPMLRSARISLRPATLLKWEGIVNDPFGALLAFVVFEIAVLGAGSAVAGDGETSIASILVHVILRAIASGVIGGVCAVALGIALQRGHIAEQLKSPVILAAVLVVFSVSEAVGHETGLIAVTVMGVVLANTHNHSLEDVRKFKEQIGTMLVAFLFLVLSARLEAEALLELLTVRSILLIVTILVVARPVVVAIAAVGSPLRWQERALIGWIAPRGVVAAAVAGAFAPRLVEAGYPDAKLLVPLVFGVIIATVVLHGLSIRPLSRKLGLGFVEGTGILIVGAQTWGVALAQALEKAGAFVVLADSRYQRVSHARREGINVYYGDVLSEEAAMELPLERVSRVLATTDDDSYNSLVSMSFASEIGRQNALQVTPGTVGTRKETAHAMVGTTPWGERGTYSAMSRRYWRRGAFKVTTITEEFDWKKLKEKNEGALFLFFVESERLYVLDGKRTPPSGAKVVYLVSEGGVTVGAPLRVLGLVGIALCVGIVVWLGVGRAHPTAVPSAAVAGGSADGSAGPVQVVSPPLEAARSQRHEVDPEQLGDSPANRPEERVEVNGEAIPGERAGDYTLEVVLLDRDGAPIEGAEVRIYRGENTSVRVYAEATATSSEDGRAQLDGRTVGAKTLVVDARSRGFCLKRLPWPVVAGPSRTTLLLDRGGVVKGRVFAADGAIEPSLTVLQKIILLRLRTGPGDWIHHEPIVLGDAFEFRGVDPGPVVLSLREGHRHWAPFEREGYALMGTETVVDLPVELAPRSDAESKR